MFSLFTLSYRNKQMFSMPVLILMILEHVHVESHVHCTFFRQNLSLKQGFAVCEGQFFTPTFFFYMEKCTFSNHLPRTIFYPHLLFLHGKGYIFKSLANQSMMCKSMRNKSQKSIYIKVEIVTNLQFLQPKNFLKHFF